MELEAEVFGELAAGEVARNLISLFFAGEIAKRTASADQEEIACCSYWCYRWWQYGSRYCAVGSIGGHEVLLQDSDEKRKNRSH